MHNDYFRLLNTTLFIVSKISSAQTKLTFFTTEERQKWVFPLSPTTYEIFNDHKGLKNMLNDQRYVITKEVIKVDANTDQTIEKRYRFQSFMILKSFINSPFMNVREFTKSDRLIARTRAFMDNLFPLMIIRGYDNFSYVECASELLSLILSESRRFLVQELKKDIFEIYNYEGFFNCTINTLKYWSKIIDMTITNCKEDIFADYLNKVSFSSFFVRKTSENVIKIRSFERVCFIIYSGEMDKYMTKTKIKTL